LRRIIIIGTTFVVLAGAAVAYAAFNNYTGTKISFTSSGAGSKTKPLAVGELEHLQANAPAGDRAAPLTNIKVTIYGAQLNGKLFPKCTDSMIEANQTKFDAACPSGSRIGSGPVHALLGPPTNPSQSAGITCDTVLHVYNGGATTQVFFFTEPNPQNCGGLRTGATKPYDGHISRQGNNLVVNVPLPKDISTQVPNAAVGFYGSLITETLTFPRKVAHGRGYMEFIGCKNGKRPWSVTYTAQDYNNGGSETQTVKGSAKC